MIQFLWFQYYMCVCQCFSFFVWLMTFLVINCVWYLFMRRYMWWRRRYLFWCGTGYWSWMGNWCKWHQSVWLVWFWFTNMFSGIRRRNIWFNARLEMWRVRHNMMFVCNWWRWCCSILSRYVGWFLVYSFEPFELHAMFQFLQKKNMISLNYRIL